MNLPDITAAEADKLAAQLTLIQKAAEADVSESDLWLLIRQAVHGYCAGTPHFPSGTKVFRAREAAKKPRNTSALHRPPHSKQSGRANLAGESVFYGSLESPAACLFECRATVGQVFALATWRTTQEMALQTYGYDNLRAREFRASKESGPWMRSSTGRLLDAVLSDWFSRVFTAEANHAIYRISTALFKIATSEIRDTASNTIGRFAGILYPSVASFLCGDNVALTSNYSDTSLEFVCCDLVEVLALTSKQNFGDGKRSATIRQLDFTDKKLADGRLVWMSEQPTSTWYAIRRGL